MNILIEENPAFNCLDMLIAAIAKYDNKDYRLMFIDSWRFIYNTKPWEYLGDRIEIHSLKWAYLKKYHGFDVNIVQKKTKEEKLEFVKQQLNKNRPIIMKLDMFYCPWTFTSYKILHSPHYCIITDIDEEHVYCIDSYVINNRTTITYEEFSNACLLFLTIDYIKVNDNYDWKFLIKKELNCIKKYNMIDSILTFNNDIKCNFDVNKEIKAFRNMAASPTLYQLGEVIRNRRRFALALSYLVDTFNLQSLEIIISKLLYVSNLWGMIYGMLIKTKYIDNEYEYIDKTTDKIEQIAKMEQTIIDDLDDLIADKPIKQFNPYIYYSKCEFSEYKYLDIETYFNNNAFGYKDKALYYPNITGDDRFLVINEKLKNILEVDNIKFHLPSYTNENNDNIECYSQKIDIQKQIGNKKFDSLFVLGCSDIGSHIDNIIVQYSDGTKEYKELRLSSWLSETHRFNDFLAWFGEGAVLLEDRIKCYDFDVHLYANVIEIDSDKIISSIELPYCPNIHVFSITLATKNA